MKNQLNILNTNNGFIELLSQLNFLPLVYLRAEDSNIVCSFAFTQSYYTNKNIPKSITGGTL